VEAGPESLVRVSWSARKGSYMKKVKSDDLRPEYEKSDLGQGVRGKYLKSYQKGTNLVLLSPDVARVFTNEESVNEALRSLINLAQRTTEQEKVQKRAPKTQGDKKGNRLKTTSPPLSD
jgi:hypothetical protein